MTDEERALETLRRFCSASNLIPAALPEPNARDWRQLLSSPHPEVRELARDFLTLRTVDRS